MKRRRRLRALLHRVLLLALVVALMLANSLLGTQAPAWMIQTTLGLAGLLAFLWVLWR